MPRIKYDLILFSFENELSIMKHNSAIVPNVIFICSLINFLEGQFHLCSFRCCLGKIREEVTPFMIVYDELVLNVVCAREIEPYKIYFVCENRKNGNGVNGAVSKSDDFHWKKKACHTRDTIRHVII